MSKSLKNIVEKEEKLRARRRIWRYILSFIFLLLIGVSVFISGRYLWDKFTENLAIIYPEEERNIRKFYETFEVPAVGSKASLFRLRDVETDKLFDLGDKRSHYLLLVFQVTKCPNCISMEEDIKGLNGKTSEDKLEVVTVTVEQDKQSMLDYREEYGIKRLWLNDDKAVVSTGYRISRIPAWFLIDQDNVIRLTGTSKMDVNRILDTIEEGD